MPIGGQQVCEVVTGYWTSRRRCAQGGERQQRTFKENDGAAGSGDPNHHGPRFFD